jgi:hypothetical protein
MFVKKFTDFHDATFAIIIVLTSVYAVFYFWSAPRLLLMLSILPLISIVLRGSVFGIFSYLKNMNPPAILLSAPLLLLFQGIFNLFDGSLKAPKVQHSVKESQTDADELEKGDDVTKGVYLGVIDGNKKQRFYLDSGELTKHTALVGTTGSGKTTTIYNFVQYAMLKQQALIIIDGKGDIGLVQRIEAMAQEFGRPFYLFSTDSDSLGYNPLQAGNPSELTDKIMSLTDWSEEHYKLNAQRFLQLLFKVFRFKGMEPDLVSVVRYANRGRLEDLLKSASGPVVPITVAGGVVNLGSLGQPPPDIPEEIQEIMDSLGDIDKRAIEGLSSRLGVIAEGDLGGLLKERPTGILELSEAMENEGVVLFSLNSLTYPEQARLLGRLVISDIKSQISYHARHRPGKRVSLIFDEFNVFVSGSVVDLVNKSRAAGFEALLAFQSLADIDRLEHGKDIRRQIIQNCNTLIVQRQNDPADAEELANVVGTEESFQLTYQISEEGSTGLGSARGVKRYKFHPDDIKKLRIGQALIKYHTAKGRQADRIIVRELS